MIEPLPPELAKLIAAERAAPVAGHAIRAVVRAKVAVTVAGAPLGAAAAGAGALGVGKILAIIAVVIGAGTVAVVKTRSASTPSQPRVVQAVPHVVKPEPPTPPPAAEEQPAPAPPVAPHPSPKPGIPSQAELLQQAWSSLSRGEAQHALDLAIKDAQVHAGGALAEEREALRIVALAKLGRASEATDASSTFLANYPASIHREVIARAISRASE